MGRKGSRADHVADTRGKGWIGLPHAVAESLAYQSLDPFERAEFGEILRRFNGYNNGEIGVSYEQIGAGIRGPNKCLPHKGRIKSAIGRLVDVGLIGMPEPENWLQRRARTYRLTFITSGKRPPYQRATNEYANWRPEKKKDGDAGSPVKALSGDARSPEAHPLGDAGSPASAKNGSFALVDQTSSGDAGSPLIVKPYPAPQNREREDGLIDPDFTGGAHQPATAKQLTDLGRMLDQAGSKLRVAGGRP